VEGLEEHRGSSGSSVSGKQGSVARNESRSARRWVKT